MILFPAIDILDNRAVRLLYGKRKEVTDYGNPIDRAELWINEGAEYLHIVDLNGAFDNSSVNKKTLKDLIANINVPVQIGGGIKSLDKVKYYLEEIGASRVIIGSSCVTDKIMVEKSCSLFGDKIACGIDAKDDKVCIKGWVEAVDLSPLKLALDMRDIGIKTVIYTDISRDGALTGVNINATYELQKKTGMDIIASGGLNSIKDIIELNKKGVYGAILGRAIYTGDVKLRDAVKEAIRKC